MAYSTSITAIARVKDKLDAMVEAANTQIEWPSNEPHKLAYHIREAINIAKQKKIPHYAELAAKYIIRVRAGKVLADPRIVLDVDKLRVALSKTVLSDLREPLEIVGAAITHHSDELFFPDAILKDDTLVRIHRWATANGYYMIVGEGLTLTKNNPGEIVWTPNS